MPLLVVFHYGGCGFAGIEPRRALVPRTVDAESRLLSRRHGSRAERFIRRKVLIGVAPRVLDDMENVVPKKKTAGKKMSADHKAALAKGREQGRAVREYLSALNEEKTPGRKLDPDTLQQRIGEAQEQVDAEPDPAKRVDLIQKRLNYEERLANIGEQVDLEALKKEFIKVAKEYSERKGIAYMAWREAGVPAAALKEAGIPRTRRTRAV